MLKNSTNQSRQDVYLGETMFEAPQIARIVPRAVARAEGWQPVDPSAFPEEGSVFSIDPKLVRRRKGYVALFTVVPNDRLGREGDRPGRDRYKTYEVDEPVEILDGLRGLDVSALRATIMSTGVFRGLQTDPRVLVPVEGGCLAFPRLQANGQAQDWTLSHLEDPERIELFADEIAPGEVFKIDGRSYLLPGRQPAAVVGHANWQTDGEFLQSLLKRVRRNADYGHASDDFRLTVGLSQRLHALLRNAEIVGGRDGVIEAANARLGEFLSKLDAGSEAASQIADAVFANPAVHDRLVSLSEDELAELRRTEAERIREVVKADIEREIADRLAIRDELRESASVADAEAATAKAELSKIEGLLVEAKERLGGSLGSMIGEFRLVSGTIERMMNVAGQAQAPSEARPVRGIGANFPPWGETLDRLATPVAIERLPDVLRERAASRGLEEDGLRRLDILCRAGEIPVLNGTSSERALDCYAGVVTGGRLRRMPVDPTVLGPDDLWRHSVLGTATPLAAAWRDASVDPSETVFVVVDDLDRASLSDWFPRFRTLYRTHRPANLLLIATASSGADAKEESLRERLDCRVRLSGNKDAFVAALMAAGNTEETLHRLIPYPPFSDFDARQRAALSARLAAGEPGGGDLGERLLAIYSSARAWGDHEFACVFVGDCLSGGTSAQPTAPADNGGV